MTLKGRGEMTDLLCAAIERISLVPRGIASSLKTLPVVVVMGLESGMTSSLTAYLALW